MYEKIINALEKDCDLYYKIKDYSEAKKIAEILADNGYFGNEVWAGWSSVHEFLSCYSDGQNCLLLFASKGYKDYSLVDKGFAINRGFEEYKPIETIVNPTYDDLAPLFSDVDNSIKLDIVQDYDPVERPKHYNVFEREVIYVIKDLLDNNDNYSGFESYCIGNSLKYIFRAGLKGDYYEDLEKARYYIDKILGGEKVDNG